MKLKTPRVLFASRAIESPPYEGGFVLLSSLVDVNNIEPSFFSVSKDSRAGIHYVPVFKDTGWDKKRGREFLVGLAKNAHKFDVVHTAHIPTKQNVRLIKLATKRAHIKGTKFVQTITGVPKVSVSQKQLAKLLWGDVIVCQSEKMFKRVQSLHKNVQFIPTWPTSDHVAYDAARRETTRKELLQKFPGKEKIVIFPGEFDRLGVDKSFEQCLKVFFKDSPESLVVLACRFDKQGTGAYLEKKFRGKVHSIGETADIVALMEAADLMIYPTKKMDSKFQPPLVLTESLQLGTPILISDGVDMSEGNSGMIQSIDLGRGWEVFAEHMSAMLNKKRRARSKTNNKNFEAMRSSYQKIYQDLAK